MMIGRINWKPKNNCFSFFFKSFSRYYICSMFEKFGPKIITVCKKSSVETFNLPLKHGGGFKISAVFSWLLLLLVLFLSLFFFWCCLLLDHLCFFYFFKFLLSSHQYFIFCWIVLSIQFCGVWIVVVVVVVVVVHTYIVVVIIFTIFI